MFLIWLLVLVVVVIFIVALPYVSGIASYDVERKKKVTKKTVLEPARETAPVGYVPPSFDTKNEDEDASASGISSLKEKIKLTSEDIPLKLHLNDISSLRRRKADKVDIDTNPNNYDYDLDELIKEEWNDKPQPPVTKRTTQPKPRSNQEVRELV